MAHSVVLVITAATIGQIGLSASMLCLRSLQSQAYLPLALFLLATAVVISGPIVAELSPSLQANVTAFSLPALLILPPCLWLYVVGLCAERPWRFCRKHSWHFLPAIMALIVSIVTVCLPLEMREALLVRGEESGLGLGTPAQNRVALIAIIIAFLMLMGWVVQSSVYLIFAAYRLSRYRVRLKDIFASTEFRELKWLSVLLLVVGTSWLLAVLTFLSDDVIPHVDINATFASAVVLATIWSLSIWGLRQKPGFEELYHTEALAPLADAPIASFVSPDGDTDSGTKRETDGQNKTKYEAKYERSALDDEQSRRIAQKIELAVQHDRLYLDASLSLQKLAKHIAVSPNYISQVLNETIGMNFFDFVNRHRIDTAKPMILEGSDTVLDVAMNVGFNARSSFYTAFKKETGLTPSGYRKQASMAVSR